MAEEPDTARFSTGFPSGAISVTQLNRSVRDLIEHSFALLWVRGEISNCVAARSGHVYFALKDAHSQVRCVMFRNRAGLLGWNPSDGVEVEVQALVTLYEPRGDYQLVVESMRRAGRGALAEKFQRLKDKLEREGLFDAVLKRPLPYLPRAVGIVTSLQAAALHDVLTSLARRNPSIPVVVYPAAVQGEAASAEIARALARAGARSECDVVIVCRGGGTIEDLWPFNEEIVARAIRACPIPVVSGVGHETDFSIADFAADRRAATPSAAAELVSPLRDHLLATAAALVLRLTRRLGRELEVRAQTVDHYSRRLAHPAKRLADKAQLVLQLRSRLSLAARRAIEERAWRISALAHRTQALLPRTGELAAQVRARLNRARAAIEAAHQRHGARIASLIESLGHLSPERVLERGYSVVQDAAGHVVGNAAALSAGERVQLRFARGSAIARVERTLPDR